MAQDLTPEETRKIEELVSCLRDRDIDRCVLLADLPPPNEDVLRQALRSFIDVIDFDGDAYSISADGFAKDGSRFIRIRFRRPSNIFLSMISELHQGRRMIRLTNMAQDFVFEPRPKEVLESSVIDKDWTQPNRVPNDFLTEGETRYIEDAVKAIANRDVTNMFRLSHGSITPESIFWKKIDMVTEKIMPLVDERERVVARIGDDYYLVSQTLFTRESGPEPSDIVLEFELRIAVEGRKLSILTVYIT